MNILRSQDFKELKPGESTAPLRLYLLGAWRAPKEGVYTVRVVYDVSGIHAAEFTTANGPPEPAALPLLDRLPRGRHVSPVLKFTVEP